MAGTVTYSLSSPILGTGRATAAQVQDWIRRHNPKAPQLGTIIVTLCMEMGPNSDIVAAQVAHETGWWTSYAAVSLNNPAGVGITNDLPQAQWPGFPTIRDGIRAQLAHLLTYVKGANNPYKADDPRYQAAVDAGYAGKVETVGGLGGTWAWPGTTYGASLVSLANDLTATIGGTQPVTTFITEVDETNWNGPNRPGYPMTAKSITVHETANKSNGADAMMHAKFVQNGGGSEGVSFHHCVDDHEAVRILPDTENAWHAGDGRDGTGNRTSIAIETCVNADGDWNTTKQNLVKLLAQLCHDHGFPADSAHIVQHNHWSGKDCPHQIRAEGSWDSIISQTAALLAGNAPTPPADTPRWFPETQHCVSYRIQGILGESHDDALFLWGYPAE